MRKCFIFAAAVLSLLAASVHARPRNSPQSNPGSNWKCGPHVDELSYGYELAVVNAIEPPVWKGGLIMISVGTAVSINLWSDGNVFKLWATTSAVRFRDVERSLLQLNQACRLPMEPEDAARLLKVKWESSDLSPAEFAQLHSNFIKAPMDYEAIARDKYDDAMRTKEEEVRLGGEDIHVTYRNGYGQQITAEVLSDPEYNKPMLDWIHELQRVATGKFHRQFGPD